MDGNLNENIVFLKVNNIIKVRIKEWNKKIKIKGYNLVIFKVCFLWVFDFDMKVNDIFYF